LKQQAAHAVVANFVLGVASSGFAFGLSCCGDICAVHGANQGELCLPLWSDGEVARRMQRRYWPKLVVTRIALSEILERCLPKARADGVPIGLGVAVATDAVVVPPQLVELGLREAEQFLRERAGR
jgi:hypothetical protein